MNSLTKIFSYLVLMSFLLLATSQTRAAMTIEITQGVSGALPIAVVPFGMAPNVLLPQDVSAIVQADLIRSGRFKSVSEKDFITQPHEGHEVNFRDWRLLDVPYLLIGKVSSREAGYFDIQFQLFDVFKSEQMEGVILRNVTEDRLRGAAHQISDLVYEVLTGEKGAFSTRIMYVVAEPKPGNRDLYSLQVSDIDGYGPQKILTSSEPIMSPSWAPNGEWVAYVSYESNGSSAIFVQEVATGQRRMVSNHQGINGAPAWSPDGKQLALTLSKGTNPDIYILDLASNKLQRITKNYAIDTEPSWAPDGKSIVFTSDRGGNPHIYQYHLSDKSIKRVTFEGRYNARASFSPDGKLLTFIHRPNKKFNVAVMEMATGAVQILSDGRLDESPSFSPNGSMIIYATEDRYSGVLAAVSVDGSVKQRLAMQEGDIREPAWAPFNN
ncbi:MAG: Tol-Pal system beta propeller repeat protein TolB [Gammaproteobacteria bacterium]|nr:Tol-Pal system beta propeller repeat protein TolB [Gammaproteobacteria bacterium]MCF6229402.1 Tol-Pal system beta propeller repeat protein TolB [Gammaproteobacteria bacterium]